MSLIFLVIERGKILEIFSLVQDWRFINITLRTIYKKARLSDKKKGQIRVNKSGDRYIGPSSVLLI